MRYIYIFFSEEYFEVIEVVWFVTAVGCYAQLELLAGWRHLKKWLTTQFNVHIKNVFDFSSMKHEKPFQYSSRFCIKAFADTAFVAHRRRDSLFWWMSWHELCGPLQFSPSPHVLGCSCPNQKVLGKSCLTSFRQILPAPRFMILETKPAQGIQIALNIWWLKLAFC